MAIEHTVSATDTVESIALAYLSDAARWIEIVEYNKLSHPYIVQDKLYYDQFRARGYLKVIRSQFTTELTIAKGSTFRTRVSSSSGVTKTYLSVENVTFAADVSEAYIYVQAEIAGTFGNTLQNTITVGGDIFLPQGGSYNGSSLIVTNEEPFTSGKNVNVKYPGDKIFIPVDSEDESVPVTTQTSYLNKLGGTDFQLDSDGDIVFDLAAGDIGAVTGLDNIAQAVVHRLMTEKGSMPAHPEYGTMLGDLIGRPQTPYISRLMELDIYDSMGYEDRIEKVKINSLTIEGTLVDIDITYNITKNPQEVQRQKIELNFS